MTHQTELDVLMIKFEVLNRFTGAVQLIAEIDCDESKSRSFKLGLSVRWALERDASLTGANLTDADLRYASLAGVNLAGVNLAGANLTGAILADADLRYASLTGAILTDADLRDANLAGVNLTGANLAGVNLADANLRDASGLNDWVKCIQIEQYPVCYTDTVLQIGCERHPIAEWAEFDDRRILEMDGEVALKFWRKYKDWIFQTIELCPARPTGTEADQ